MNSIKKIFGKEQAIIIGAVHFPPLLSYTEFPGFDVALANAIADAKAFEEGGADAVIIENNYDVPHQVFVSAAVASSMLYLGEKIKEQIKVPMGVSVLWNDYEAALSIAKIICAQFIRIPVFVDMVKTDYGLIEGDPSAVRQYRKLLQAENVALFTDIHVKHAEMISKHNIIESARLALKEGSDAIIITGKWTGDAPNIKELEDVRNALHDFPIFCGSGVDEKNIKTLFQYANGAIVSTSLKSGGNKEGQVNVKPYAARIDVRKVRNMTNSLQM